MASTRPKPARRPTVPSAIRRRDPRPRVAGRVVVLLSTAPKAKGGALARALVDARVAACVNVVPGIESVYRWNGELETSREVLLVIKTTARARDACMRLLERIHPYDVAEVVSVRVDEVSVRYARWVDASTV